MTDAIPQDDLRPLNWEQGNIAMSPTHFYMIFNDKKLGITVQLTNRFTNKTHSRDGFESIAAAKEWVKAINNRI